VKQSGKKFALPGRIHVRIGAAAQFEAGTDPQKITQELERWVAEL
jgi:hypothetical protein